jgi:hypothetical protein
MINVQHFCVQKEIYLKMTPKAHLINSPSPAFANKAINLFNDRVAILGSMHNKEKSIGPVLEKALNIKILAAQGLDTDCLGTFTGEIERTGAPRENALKKCHMALELSKADLAIATEGSFGPHPQFPFLPLHEEWIALVDKKNGIQICLAARTIQTNFSARWVNTKEELLSFLTSIGFPFHGVIVSDSDTNRKYIQKGLRNLPDVYAAFQTVLYNSPQAYVESDMRAMHNPSRMVLLVQLAKKLASALQTPCPHCQKPGYTHVSNEPGLPCSLCGDTTEQPAWHIYSCQQCHFHEKYPVADPSADPTYCLTCNP